MFFLVLGISSCKYKFFFIVSYKILQKRQREIKKNSFLLNF